MKQNSIISAPQCKDVESLYKLWRQNHAASREDFYRFVTTPSVDRDSFLAPLKMSMVYDQSVCMVTVNYSEDE